MAEYEVVREVQNLCANNQMRDVFFDEIETDDPVEWIRREVKGKEVNLTVDRKADACCPRRCSGRRQSAGMLTRSVL